MADEIDLERCRSGIKDLSGCDLNGADLSDLDLSGRDFTRANLGGVTANRTNFAGASFRNANLATMQAEGANFSGVDLSTMPLYGLRLEGSSFKDANFQRSVISSVLFTECDLTGADFSNAQFENCGFENAQTDSRTKFDNASGPRPLTRLKAFRFYDYDRSRFVRRSDNAGDVDPADVMPPTISLNSAIEPATTAASEKVLGGESASPTMSTSETTIIAKIAEAPNKVRDGADRLVETIEAHRRGLEQSKPNDPIALERYEDYLAFLSKLAEELKSLSQAIRAADEEADPSRKREGLQNAARVAANLGNDLVEWVKDNSPKIASSAGTVGVVGLLFWFCSALGMTHWEAFPLACSAMGADQAIAAAKALAKPDRKRGKAKKAKRAE